MSKIIQDPQFQDRIVEELLARKTTPTFVLHAGYVENEEDSVLYREGDKDAPKSYLWLKREIQEVLKYPEYIFSFDDENHRISCREPFSIASVDKNLVKAINDTFGEVINHKVVGKIKGEDEMPAVMDLDAEEIETKARPNIIDLSQNITDIVKPPKPSVRDFNSLFQNNFCVGETHSDISPKRFLQDNMQSLKANGYGTLFLEHVFYETTIQESFNRYHAAEAESEMPRDLSCYLEYLGRRQSKRNERNYDQEYNFVELVRSAKEAGIRVVAIDSEDAYISGDSNIDNGNTRYKTLNFLANEIIKREAGDKKWMALIGEAHLETLKGVPGIADITGAISLHIYDKCKIKNDEQKEPETEAKFGRGVRDFGIAEITSDVRIGCALNQSLRVEENHIPTKSEVEMPNSSATKTSVKKIQESNASSYKYGDIFGVGK
ncbi:MAG: membrane-targeted effector domain-containing toxin [Pseudomonadota bacterium]